MFHNDALCKFQFKIAGIKSCLLQHPATYLGKFFLHKLAKRDFYGQLDMVESSTLPFLSLQTGGPQQPFTYRYDKPALLGYRDKLLWRDTPISWVIPSQKRLGAIYPARLNINLRLIIQE